MCVCVYVSLTQEDRQVEFSFQKLHFLSHRGHITMSPPFSQISLLQRQRKVETGEGEGDRERQQKMRERWRKMAREKRERERKREIER